LKAETSGKVTWKGNGRGRDNEGTPAHKVNDDCGPRQQLMIIPDRHSMQVTTEIYESIIKQVRDVQKKKKIKASIYLKAIDKTFPGTVDWIATTNHTGGWTQPGIKKYHVIVNFDGDVGAMQLDPTMSAKVEMIIERLENVLQVPITAVETEKKNKKVKHCVWKIVDGQPVKTTVNIGMSNERFVEIRSGLSENDVICTAPPADRQVDVSNGESK